jgi:hypothetical protein
MKIVRSLFLGSAAGLIAICGAQAADLPVKAKAVEYVKICSLYGAGFFYIPGTDTCIKIGGYLRVDVTFNGGPHGAPAWNGDLGQQDRYRDYYAARSRRASRLIPAPPLNTALSAPSGWPTSSLRRTAEAHSTRTLSTPTLVTIRTCLTPPAAAFEQLFLQFAGFTFGKPASAYATPWHGFPGNTTSYLLGGHDTVTGTNNIQYTAQFGNGVSGTVGLDDPTVYNRTAVYNLSTGIGATGLGANAYAGMHAADVVGNIRVDQAWGLFQVSAGAHEVSGSYNLLTAGAEQPTALSEISGHPDTKWGGSAMAALQIKNIPTGPGDDIKLDASYAVGDTKNVISAAAPSPSFAMFSGTSVAGAHQEHRPRRDFGRRILADAVRRHRAPQIDEGLGCPRSVQPQLGSLLVVRLVRRLLVRPLRRRGGRSVDGQGSVLPGLCSEPSRLGREACDPNFNVAQLGVVTRWTPVKNLALSAEVMWVHLDQKMGGIGGAAATSTFSAVPPKPTTTYQFKDQDAVSLQLRVHRNF